MKTFAKYFFLIIFICYSCTEKKTQNSNEIIVDYKANDEIKVSSFIENFKIVKLSTDNDHLIHQISKIEYIDEKIYILDIPSNCIFIFDDSGKLDKKLEKVGGGPGEYIQITDFFVDDKHLFVMDFTQQVILAYDDDLNYLQKTSFKSLGSRLINHNNFFWIYNEPAYRNPDYQFSLLNEKGKLLTEFLPRNSVNHLFNWAEANVFYTTSGEEKYLSPRYNDTIYRISNNTIQPEFIINFKDRKFPTNENINNYNIADLNFPFLVKNNFYISKKYLIFDYILERERHFCIYDKDKNVNISGLIDNDLIDNFRFFPRWGNGNYLIEELNPEILLEGFKESPQFKNFLNIEIDDNPLIIIYKLKEK